MFLPTILPWHREEGFIFPMSHKISQLWRPICPEQSLVLDPWIQPLPCDQEGKGLLGCIAQMVYELIVEILWKAFSV